MSEKGGKSEREVKKGDANFCLRVGCVCVCVHAVVGLCCGIGIGDSLLDCCGDRNEEKCTGFKRVRWNGGQGKKKGCHVGSFIIVLRCGKRGRESDLLEKKKKCDRWLDPDWLGFKITRRFPADENEEKK